MSNNSFEKLTSTIKKLRDPIEGCPWDLKQTHESLLRYLIEESYEFIQAVEEKDAQKMKDELGDVLLQVMLHSQIANETSSFDISDVIESITNKMIERHPHVFSDKKTKDLQKIASDWEKKKKKKGAYFYKQDDLNLPSLICSQKIGEKAERINFDWSSPEKVYQKVQEEILELEVEIKDQNIDKIEEELGDVFFSLVQLARHYNLDAEQTLRKANKKFISRFNKVEDLIKSNEQDLFDVSQEKLNQYWNQVKSLNTKL